MNTNQLKCQITRFHTIEEANIQIDGITILTGCHHTGKDKLLGFIYDIVRYPLLYKKYRTDKFWLKMEEFYDHLIFLCEVINPFCSKNKYLPSFKSMNTFSSENEWIAVVNHVEELYYQTFKNTPDAFSESRSAYHSKYKDIYPNNYSKDHFMYLIGIDEDPDTFPIYNIFGPAREFVHKQFNTIQEFIEARPEKEMIHYLKNKYSQIGLPEVFELSENGKVILSNTGKDFEEFGELEKVLYIDEPRFFGSSESWYLRTWDYIYQEFLEADTNITPAPCDLLARINELWEGEIVQHLPVQTYDKYEPFIKKLDFSIYPEHWFEYVRKDGKVFPVANFCFDLKTFILMERLLVNRIINDNTLLIFNNPENHLCPKQITIFAWLVAQLTARRGIRFLFSSYNPEMVNALQKACKEANLGDRFRIYEVKDGKEPYTYTFV